MRILTTAEILSGTPRSGWADEIESEGFRDESARTEWIAGAWAAVRGDPDCSKNCLCEFRRGYDWAARRALADGGWEAWNLAYREVTERRPIGRSSYQGARYYGSDHEAVPAAIRGLQPLDIALWKALHGMQGALLRWAIYRELGVDDPDLGLAISNEFGTVNSGSVDGVHYAGYGCRRYNDGGGKHARLTFGEWGHECVLSGSRLVGRARTLLELPEPGLLHLPGAPGAMAGPKPRVTCHTRVDTGAEHAAAQLVLI